MQHIKNLYVLVDLLEQAGLSENALSLKEAIEGAATGGELIGDAQVVLKGLDINTLPVNLQVAVNDAIKELDSLVRWK